MADKPSEKRQFWTLFALILGAFASLLVVGVVTNEAPWAAAHPALESSGLGFRRRCSLGHRPLTRRRNQLLAAPSMNFRAKPRFASMGSGDF